MRLHEWSESICSLYLCHRTHCRLVLRTSRYYASDFHVIRLNKMPQQCVGFDVILPEHEAACTVFLLEGDQASIRNTSSSPSQRRHWTDTRSLGDYQGRDTDGFDHVSPVILASGVSFMFEVQKWEGAREGEK